MITDITYEGAPEIVRNLEGKHYKIDPTVGDGACAIHSAFGNLTYRGVFKQNARAFLPTRGVQQQKICDAIQMTMHSFAMWRTSCGRIL